MRAAVGSGFYSSPRTDAARQALRRETLWGQKRSELIDSRLALGRPDFLIALFSLSLSARYPGQARGRTPQTIFFEGGWNDVQTEA
jgi:hypothetical protein